MRRPKVFFIGFNKTATCAVHELFLKNEYNSVHHRDNNGNNLALSMQKNIINKNDILTNLDKAAEVYSDLSYCTANKVVEGSIYYEQLHNDYPNAYFILQYRPLDHWIESRLNHQDFARRYQKALKLTQEEVVEYWKKQRYDTQWKIRTYFENRNVKFIDWNTEKQGIYTIIDFVKEHYELDPKHWQLVNVTAEKEK